MASGSSNGNAWEQLRIKMKELRCLLLASPSLERQIKCEMKKILATTISDYEAPGRYENSESVLEIMSGQNLSPLEVSFMWMGAWRPSAAISLVFSVMGLKKQGGIQVDGDFHVDGSEIVIPALSEEQLSQLHSFRDLASQAEKDLTEELATVQMMLADQDVVTDLLDEDDQETEQSKLKATLDSKVCSLRDVLKRADQLRIKTLLELHALLTAVQAARCSIAAFEFAFAMRSLNTATSRTY